MKRSAVAIALILTVGSAAQAQSFWTEKANRESAEKQTMMVVGAIVASALIIGGAIVFVAIKKKK